MGKTKNMVEVIYKARIHDTGLDFTIEVDTETLEAFLHLTSVYMFLIPKKDRAAGYHLILDEIKPGYRDVKQLSVGNGNQVQITLEYPDTKTGLTYLVEAYSVKWAGKILGRPNFNDRTRRGVLLTELKLMALRKKVQSLRKKRKERKAHETDEKSETGKIAKKKSGPGGSKSI